jgi:hypothetical protein
MRPRLGSLVIVVALTAGAAGCGAEPAGSSGTSVSSSVSASPSGPASVPDPDHPTDQVRRAGQRSRFTRLTGTVLDGTEPGCLLLKADDGKTYLLIGGRPSVLRAGQRVDVVGARDDTSSSTCQEGIGFLVTADRTR